VLRTGVALKHPAILERQGVKTFFLRVRVEIADLVDEFLRLAELVEDPFQGLVVVFGGQHIVGYPPHPRKDAIEGFDFPLGINE
jgi:hypothetical protein